ncbi:acyl carrier protein [Saprospira grandis]|uniref:Acyl carrier protein n=1 Tax=Saprospira grandis (strain Lewin) TaxID=984262 RepID=H6L5M2_SAPGL|nr:acyl carrier protein [Saprospira grandis]AFC25238.1 acyl carrier protein [Saprospira grandis str. Lewin]WBM73333.1 acyl carrier protein [Saprospira grandis]
MATEIKERVVAIIADKLVVELNDVTEDANFQKDLGADSIDLVELIMELEREFDLSIPDEKAEEIKTVGDAISFLSENLG